MVRRHGSRGVRPWSLGWAIALGLAFGATIAPAGATAQVTSYSDYRTQTANFLVRADNLSEKIAKIDVKSAFCTDAERRAVGRQLAEAFSELGQLARDWSDFKNQVKTFGATQQGIGQFGPGDRNPNDPNFWGTADNEVVAHVKADLDAKREEFRKTKVIDCNPPKASSPPGQPAPPKTDPLAGLTRPKLITQKLPPAPKPFCSEEERWAWINSVIRPLMNENIDASWALREYSDKVWDRLQAATAPGKHPDPDAVRALEKELKWSHEEHEKLDRFYFDQIVKLRESAVVIDCTEHFTTPQPVAPVDTTHPHTQERPGTGSPPVDTTHPRTQEKPGTGAPKGTEPRVGALPGGRLPGGEWRIGGGFDENWYQDYAHTAGDQQGISGFNGKQTTPGWGAEVGLRFGAWQARVCRHVNTLHLTQYYGVGAPYQRLDGDLDGSFYDVDLERRLGLVWNTYIGVFGGTTFAYDVLQFRTLLPSGATIDQPSRTLKTWKTNFGLAIERPLTPDLGLRLGSTYTTAGKSGDADANLRVSAGMTYRLPIHFSY